MYETISEFVLHYNIDGANMSETAYERLKPLEETNISANVMTDELLHEWVANVFGSEEDIPVSFKGEGNSVILRLKSLIALNGAAYLVKINNPEIDTHERAVTFQSLLTALLELQKDYDLELGNDDLSAYVGAKRNIKLILNWVINATSS